MVHAVEAPCGPRARRCGVDQRAVEAEVRREWGMLRVKPDDASTNFFIHRSRNQFGLLARLSWAGGRTSEYTSHLRCSAVRPLSHWWISAVGVCPLRVLLRDAGSCGADELQAIEQLELADSDVERHDTDIQHNRRWIEPMHLAFAPTQLEGIDDQP